MESLLSSTWTPYGTCCAVIPASFSSSTHGHLGSFQGSLSLCFLRQSCSRAVVARAFNLSTWKLEAVCL